MQINNFSIQLSYPIVMSHHIHIQLSCRIISYAYHIICISYHIICISKLSFHIISYHIISNCHVISCSTVISYQIISYPTVISYHIISCTYPTVMSDCYIISYTYHIVSYHIISYHIHIRLSYHIISNHIHIQLPCHIQLSYHIISYACPTVISNCHIISNRHVIFHCHVISNRHVIFNCLIISHHLYRYSLMLISVSCQIGIYSTCFFYLMTCQCPIPSLVISASYLSQSLLQVIKYVVCWLNCSSSAT